MNTMLFAFLLFPMLQNGNGAPAGSPEAGKTAWAAAFCKNCHGNQGEGAYGPDLAGRGLSYAQFKHAVHKPWGVMPAFTERQMSDQTVADVFAYLMGLPKVAEPGAWREPAPPPDAPRGQMLLITNGCGQCHEPELRNPRMVLGGEATDVDFPYFAKRVYEHTDVYPDGRMGNFSKIRLPEPILQDIFRFAIHDLGLLVPIAPEIPPGVPAGANTTYTLTMKNRGVKGKGLTAEDLTISLVLPPGSTVVSTTGTGYKGVHRDPKSNSDVAVWQVPRLAPDEEQAYTLTLSGTRGKPSEIFKGSVVRWTKPEMRKGFPNLAIRDTRMPGKDPQTPVTFPLPKT